MNPIGCVATNRFQQAGLVLHGDELHRLAVLARVRFCSTRIRLAPSSVLGLKVFVNFQIPLC